MRRWRVVRTIREEFEEVAPTMAQAIAQASNPSSVTIMEEVGVMIGEE
jgi:hypothetical protein